MKLNPVVEERMLHDADEYLTLDSVLIIILGVLCVCLTRLLADIYECSPAVSDKYV